eukprot:CAMPEP_0181173090 /NCGR_PEP_ID=MMETSP1096-20121128/2804_1 /TAXON_ID=156174 ORGANISM="Chrysochromulina ericina, Strain CCMP281" /NCGR_SAMPLE_ID=MMETSP1096 /ASSEMBLY_ACC=CAM_ASM_000453 /LENGTH=53 /DNA_ID=CAMNT_0023260875 /DNA_START=652 /DNA_END=813 /DNA_ORIENTATION=-
MKGPLSNSGLAEHEALSAHQASRKRIVQHDLRNAKTPLFKPACDITWQSPGLH